MRRLSYQWTNRMSSGTCSFSAGSSLARLCSKSFIGSDSRVFLSAAQPSSVWGGMDAGLTAWLTSNIPLPNASSPLRGCVTDPGRSCGITVATADMYEVGSSTKPTANDTFNGQCEVELVQVVGGGGLGNRIGWWGFRCDGLTSDPLYIYTQNVVSQL